MPPAKFTYFHDLTSKQVESVALNRMYYVLFSLALPAVSMSFTRLAMFKRPIQIEDFRWSDIMFFFAMVLLLYIYRRIIPIETNNSFISLFDWHSLIVLKF